MITAAQLHDIEFERKFRGYDEQAVDNYLDQIAVYIENLTKENSDLREKLKSTQDQLTYLKNLEGTLRDTLVTAQRSADETTRTANQKAEEIVLDAQEQARRILEQAKEELTQSANTINTMKQQAAQYKQNMLIVMQQQMRLLDESGIELPPVEERPRRTTLIDDPLPRREE